MEFFIRKNATLPVLKINAIKDGRSDYNRSMRFLEDTEIFFSMVDTETNVPRITSRPAGLMKKVPLNVGDDDQFFVYYQFTPFDTKKVGRYKGQFLFRNETGILLLPLSEEIYVNVTESFVIDDFEFQSCYVVDYPCCIGPVPPKPPVPPGPPTTTTTTHVPTTTTTTTIQPPPNDFTYLIIPNNDLAGEDIPNNDLHGEDIPNNDLHGEDIPNGEFDGDVIPNNDLNDNQIPNDGLGSEVIPNNDVTPTILECDGETYNLVVLPFAPPSGGNIIFPGFSTGPGNMGITDPNSFEINSVYWNQINSDGIDTLNYFSGLLDPFIITFTQNGNSAVYSGETGSVVNNFGVFYSDPFLESTLPLTLLQPSPSQFNLTDPVCISFVNIPPDPPTIQKIVDINMNNPISYSGGTTVYDLSGNTNATLVNNPTVGFDTCYSAVTTNGTDQYIITDTSIDNFYVSSPNPADTSVFLWVYITGNGCILDELGQPSINTNWHDAQIDVVSGKVNYNIWPYFIPNIESSAITYNQWYYIGFTYSGTTFTAYMNGQVVGSSTITRETPYQFGNGLYYGIANSDNATNLGDGNYSAIKFGQLEIWNGAISNTDVLQNYNNNVGYWVC